MLFFQKTSILAIANDNSYAIFNIPPKMVKSKKGTKQWQIES